MLLLVVGVAFFLPPNELHRVKSTWRRTTPPSRKRPLMRRTEPHLNKPLNAPPNTSTNKGKCGCLGVPNPQDAAGDSICRRPPKRISVPAIPRRGWRIEPHKGTSLQWRGRPAPPLAGKPRANFLSPMTRRSRGDERAATRLFPGKRTQWPGANECLISFQLFLLVFICFLIFFVLRHNTPRQTPMQAIFCT